MSNAVTDITLAASTFEVAWTHARLGELPIVLYVPPRGFHEWEREQVVRQAWAELQQFGPAAPGRLPNGLHAMFEVLAMADRVVDARLSLGRAGQPGTDVRGMAAACGDQAVLARLAGDVLTLRPITAESLSREIVTLLPGHPAGPGASVSLPREQLEPAALAAGSSVFSFAERLVEQGAPGHQARTLARMIAATVRRGQFGAAVRDRSGRRRAAQRAVAFHDTATGRYLMADHVSADGRVWTTVTPATAHLLAEHVQTLLTNLG